MLTVAGLVSAEPGQDVDIATIVDVSSFQQGYSFAAHQLKHLP